MLKKERHRPTHTRTHTNYKLLTYHQQVKKVIKFQFIQFGQLTTKKTLKVTLPLQRLHIYNKSVRTVHFLQVIKNSVSIHENSTETRKTEF